MRSFTRLLSSQPARCICRLPRTIGSVATPTGYHLDTHPQTNQALTTISQQQAGPQSVGSPGTTGTGPLPRPATVATR